MALLILGLVALCGAVAAGAVAITMPAAGDPRVARSLAQWMTYELLGLWAGDDRPGVLEWAEGRAQGGPDFIVELSVRKNGR